MQTRIAVLAVLGIVLAGCGADATRSSPSPATSSIASQALAPVLSSAPPSPTLDPTPAGAATASPGATAPAPPPPTAVRMTREGCYTGPDPGPIPSGECIQTVTWKEVATRGTEVRVYGVTRCLLQTERTGSGECLRNDTRVPGAVRRLIASAPASAGLVSWTRPAWLDNVQVASGDPASRAFGVDRDGDDIYFGILVAAYDAGGRSTFVVADAGGWCYDTGCAGP